MVHLAQSPADAQTCAMPEGVNYNLSRQASFQRFIDPLKNLVGQRCGKIGPRVARQVEQRHQESVEQFAGLVRARRCWRDRGSLPRLGYQRRRAAACDERARCGIATPNLIDGQGAGGNSTRGPPAP